MTNPTAPDPTGSVPATSSIVTKFHTNSDLDSSVTAQHHSLGILHNQASPGDHKHDGKASKLLGKGLDLTFPTTAGAAYTQAQIQSIINALRKLGFGV
jgi:hypothetical protein